MIKFVSLIKIWGSSSHQFNPGRFLDTNGKFLGKSSNRLNEHRRANLVPFSVGKRDCLGKVLAEREFLWFFVGLLYEFEFTRIEEARVTIEVFSSTNNYIPGKSGAYYLRLIHNYLQSNKAISLFL